MSAKGKNTSFDLRQLVIYHNAKGKSYREITEMLKIPKSTVADIIKRFRDEDRIDSIPQKGRPKVLTNNSKRQIMRKVKADPKISAAKLITELTLNCSDQTVRNVIHENGYFSRSARKKPFINEVDRNKRLAFAKEHLNKGIDFWKEVIFCDESKFNLFGSDGRPKVWRKPNTELEIQNMIPTVKHGGGSVMVWGCIAASGTGNLDFIETTMDRYVYLDVLKNNLKASAEKLGVSSTFKFYQDNDPKHKSYLVRE